MKATYLKMRKKLAIGYGQPGQPGGPQPIGVWRPNLGTVCAWRELGVLKTKQSPSLKGEALKDFRTKLMRPIWRGVTPQERQHVEHEILVNLDALYGYALSLTRNPSEAEDLVQETCLRAIKRARRFAPTGALKPWLFTILRNTWINQYRRHTQGPEFLPLTPMAQNAHLQGQPLRDDQQRPDVLLEQRRLHDRMRVAIENLPAVFREVIILRLEGCSYTQIAEILGCPAGTVMSRISRARAELRRWLRRQEQHIAIVVENREQARHASPHAVPGRRIAGS